MKKSRFWTLVFSLVPGAGHMYLGLMKQGIQMMLLFFGTITLITFVGVELLGLFIPVIWFYSFFDVLHKASSEEPILDDNILLFDYLDRKKIQISNKWIAYFLIIIGVMKLIRELILPVIDRLFGYFLWHNLQTSVISLLLIAGGIKILMGTKHQSQGKVDDL